MIIHIKGKYVPTLMEELPLVNRHLDAVIKSSEEGVLGGRKYIVIDSKTISITQNVNSRCSMKEFVNIIYEVSVKCLARDASRTYARDDVLTLSEHFSTIVLMHKIKLRNKKNKLFYTLSLLAYKSLIHKTEDNFARYASYGTKRQIKVTFGEDWRVQRKEMEVSLTYHESVTIRKKKLRKLPRTMDEFAKVSAYATITSEELCRAFISELKLSLVTRSKKDLDAVHFIAEIFYTILQEYSDKIEMKVIQLDTACLSFQERIIDEITDYSIETIELDRELFNNLLEVHTRESPRDVIAFIDFEHPSFRALLNEFNSGDWKASEEKTLTYDRLPAPFKKRFYKILLRLLNLQSFKEVLSKYFTNL